MRCLFRHGGLPEPRVSRRADGTDTLALASAAVVQYAALRALADLAKESSMLRLVPASRTNGRWRSYAALAGLCLALAATVSMAQDLVVEVGSEKNVRIQRTNAAPVIDGVLDEEMWLRAPIIDDFHQVNPVEYGEPSQRTEVYLLYDRDTLFIGARLYDPEPGLINARVLRQNQPIGSDDRFFVHIDSFSNRRSGYLFGVNPNGVRYDGIFENVTERSFDWDGIWQAEATTDEQGWVLEMAIPFKTLSFDPTNDTWRMNFARNIERKNESIAWNSRNRNTDLSSMGNVRGISQIEQGLGLDIVPSASVRERKNFDIAGEDLDTEPSLDVFYKITPSLNGSLTINTDFSATEVDQRQVNLTRFNLFFPERRDFFLQDADIFQFGRLEQDGRPFFSRRLGISASGQEVPLEYGGKISGRVGRWDIGGLAIRQQEFEDVDATTAVVGRVAANLLEESSLGVIFTNGDPGSNLDNSVFGVDFRYVNSRFRGGRSVQAEGWIQQSDTEGLVGDEMAAGIGFRLPNNEGLRGDFSMSRIEQNFNPALGFVRRRGIEEVDFGFGNTWRPSGGRIRTIFSGINGNRIDYLDTGEVQSQSLNLDAINIDFNSQDSFNIGYSRDKEGLRDDFAISSNVTIPAGVYTFDTVNLSIRSGNQRALGGGFFMNDGEFYDGDRFGIGVFTGWRPNRHFRANLNYQYNEIDLPGGSFETRVVRLQLESAFSSTLSWINLIQYDNISETIGINSRLHWIPQAGREAFLVINHNLEDFDRDNSFHSIYSELTIKYSYTFRF